MNTQYELKILQKLHPQYIEAVLTGGYPCPEEFKDCIVEANVADKIILDIYLDLAEKNESVITKLLTDKIYVGLGFMHSGSGILVLDEKGDPLMSYPRKDSQQIWVRKKLIIVNPQGSRFYVTSWEFVPFAPFISNIVAMTYATDSPIQYSVLFEQKKV